MSTINIGMFSFFVSSFALVSAVPAQEIRGGAGVPGTFYFDILRPEQKKLHFFAVSGGINYRNADEFSQDSHGFRKLRRGSIRYSHSFS